MVRVVSVCFVLIFCGMLTARAGAGFRLTGKVQDEQGKALPFASAFLNQTTLGSRTSESGEFTIQHVPSGKYELIVSYLGYETKIIPVEVLGDISGITVVLTSKPGALKEVTIRRDPERERWMKVFFDSFIGQSSNAQQCRLLNGELVDLEYNRQTSALKASAEDFLVIENNALGYKVSFLLMHFQYDMRNGYCMYYGNPLFERMIPKNRKQEERWLRNREKAFYGSSTHFYRSLIGKRLDEDGYTVQKMVRQVRQPGYVPPPEKSGDSVRIKPSGVFSRYVNYLYTGKVPYDSIIRPEGNGYALHFTDLLYVTYKREKEEKLYVQFNLPPNSKPHWQTTIVKLLAPAVNMDKNGNPDAPMDIIYEQYWGWQKMAEMLPLDYRL